MENLPEPAGPAFKRQASEIVENHRKYQVLMGFLPFGQRSALSSNDKRLMPANGTERPLFLPVVFLLLVPTPLRLIC
jgi:hypothetical protein